MLRHRFGCVVWGSGKVVEQKGGEERFMFHVSAPSSKAKGRSRSIEKKVLRLRKKGQGMFFSVVNHHLSHCY